MSNPADDVRALADEHAIQKVSLKARSDHARLLLFEAAAGAVMTITHIAQHGTTERVQLDACKYILDKVLGKDSHLESIAGDPLDVMLQELIEASAS